ncbi:MAG: type II-A CRISPR-associated protein Csn2 [Erysipelotrichaceae bacterium]
MKLSIFSLEHKIDFKQHCVWSLQLIQHNMFINVVNQLCHCNWVDNFEEKIVLSLNNQVLDLDKNALVITDILKFNTVEMKSNAMFLKYIDQVATIDIEQKLEKTSRIQKELTSFSEYLYDLPFELDYSTEVPFIEILKDLNISFLNQFESLFEKIQYIIDVYAYFYPDKLLIFINQLNYISEEDMDNIVEYAQVCNQKILFVDKCLYPNINALGILEVDKDYVEWLK